MLRIACLGDYENRFSYFTFGVMQGAFYNNAWFRPISITDTLVSIQKQIEYFRPHIIFCHQIFGHFHDIEEMKGMLEFVKTKYNIRIALHEGDPKSEPRYSFDISKYVDLGLINHREVEKYSEIWKIPCIHWPYFCLVQDKPLPLKVGTDVIFTGIYSKREEDHVHYGRYEFIEEIKKKLNVKIYPNEEYSNTRFLTPKIARSTNIVLGIQLSTKIKGFIDTRPFQYIGAGALYFHDDYDSIKQFFREGSHYVGYKSKDINSFIDGYNYYIYENPKLGNHIRDNGFEYCQNNHNSKQRVQQVINFFLEGKDYDTRYL